MLVSSETLARLRKSTCSPEPSLITSVISTNNLFTKYPGTSSYGAPRKLISCLVRAEQAWKCALRVARSLVSDSRRYMTRKQNLTVHYSEHGRQLMTVQNISDAAVCKLVSARRSLNLAFSENKSEQYFKTCDGNAHAGFTLST